MSRNRLPLIASILSIVALAACSSTSRTDRGSLDEARAMLDEAVTHYETVGREQALQDFTDGKEPFVDRDLYVFCYGSDMKVSAHGANVNLLGDDVNELRDEDGFAFGTKMVEVAQAGPEGGTVEYKWVNPVSNQVESKVSVVRAVGDDVCGVGAYKSQ